MSHVIGLGGVFLLCEDPDVTARWYKEVLGLAMNDYGGFDFLHADSAKAFPTGARTIYGLFRAGSDYFKPSTLNMMVNLMVDDLDAVLKQAGAAGVEQVQPAETYDYGRFAWIMDPDGRKIELWEPVEQAAES